MLNVSDIIIDTFSQMLDCGRIPHAILIEGGTANLREEAIDYLKSYAVCSDINNRPCGKCNNCIKALKGGHSDVITPELSGKTNIISIKAVRNLIMDASIIPNESDTKVFILRDIDTCMKEDAQNAFLKILEEPPLSTLFILTCDNSKRLLSTILSRVQIFSLKKENESTQQTNELATAVIQGILSPSEDKLLYATAKLNSRATFKDTLIAVSEYLRLALNKSIGAEVDNQLAGLVAKKMTKSRILDLIDVTSNAIIRSDRNINMTLLCTWLCAEYRRISWQR